MENQIKCQTQRKEDEADLKKRLKRKRRSKRAEIRETFECECGRDYLSFSALYLHAFKKHMVKLSCKPNQQAFTCSKLGTLIKYKFYLAYNASNKSQPIFKRSPREDQMGPSEEVQAVSEAQDANEMADRLESFCKEYFVRDIDFESKEITKNFLQYVKIKNRECTDTIEMMISKSPNHLNEFWANLVEKSSMFETGFEEMRRKCEYLFDFWQWLHQNKHTELIVVRQYQ